MTTISMPSIRSGLRAFARHGRRAAAVVLLAGATAACSSTGPLNGVNVAGTSPVGVDRSLALGYINSLRGQNGLGAVRYNAALDRAAERQARAMAARGDLGHGLDGRLPERVATRGYDWATVSENIGWNYRSTQGAFDGWANSSGHRANMLKPDIQEVGLAAASGSAGEPYWALIMGRQRGR